MTTETLIPTEKETMNRTEVITAFTDAFTTDNIDNWKKLLAPD